MFRFSRAFLNELDPLLTIPRWSLLSDRFQHKRFHEPCKLAVLPAALSDLKADANLPRTSTRFFEPCEAWKVPSNRYS
jgi:hypothetical protein